MSFCFSSRMTAYWMLIRDWSSGVCSSDLLAVTLCSTGIASAFVPLLTVVLLEDFGWRTTYLLLGGMAAVAGIPILFMFFSSAKDKARRPTAPSVGPRGPAAANIPARKSWWERALRWDLTYSHFVRQEIGRAAGKERLGRLVWIEGGWGQVK